MAKDNLSELDLEEKNDLDTDLEERSEGDLKREAKDRWKPYKKKLSRSIIRSFLYAIISLILITFIFGFNFYRDTLLEFDSKNISELDNYIKIINKETRTIGNNLNLAKKYNNKWNDSSPNKKDTKGISSELFTTTLEGLTKKYNVKNANFKISVPQISEQEIFEDGKYVDIYFSACSLSLTSASDTQVLSLLKELEEKLTGYVIYSKVGITKQRDYNKNDYIQLSSGRDFGLIKTNIDFVWYTMKRKGT